MGIRTLFVVVFLCLILSFIISISDAAYGDANQQELYAKQKVKKFESVVIYIHIQAINESFHQQSVFFPEVDDFSQLVIPDCKYGVVVCMQLLLLVV